MEISSKTVYEGINDYHRIYGWAPTIRELSQLLNACNDKEIQRWVSLLRKYGKVLSDGKRTIRTDEIIYIDERSEIFIEDMDDILTRSEKQIYDYLVCSIKENAVVPTLKEIAVHIGINPEKSQSCVKRHLFNMQEKGAVILGGKRQSRAIHLVGLNAKVKKQNTVS